MPNNPILHKNLFFIKEHTGFFKSAHNFDIYDPDTQNIVLECREENISFFVKWMRLTRQWKPMSPFHIQVSLPKLGEILFHVQRKFTFFRSHVMVKDKAGQIIGSFRQKLFQLGGGFQVLNSEGKLICKLRGKVKWNHRDFSFQDESNKEIAKVNKKWAGLAKELFTTADNYVLQISDTVAKEDPIRLLILASVLCVDLVLNE